MLLAPWFNYSHQMELGEVEWVGSGFVCSESTDKISIYFKIFFLLFLLLLYAFGLGLLTFGLFLLPLTGQHGSKQVPKQPCPSLPVQHLQGCKVHSSFVSSVCLLGLNSCAPPVGHGQAVVFLCDTEMCSKHASEAVVKHYFYIAISGANVICVVGRTDINPFVSS